MKSSRITASITVAADDTGWIVGAAGSAPLAGAGLLVGARMRRAGARG
ncbi:hypothetical protein ACFYM0_37755 [Streptomyces sp. NPDC006487]